MTQRDQGTFRRLLEAKRKELLRRSTDREEILIQPTPDEFDRLQQQLTREVAIRNLDREASLLRSVQAALGRFDDELFGICLHCGEEIPEKRLKAVPWASHCVGCQERIDQTAAASIEELTESITSAA